MLSYQKYQYHRKRKWKHYQVSYFSVPLASFVTGSSDAEEDDDREDASRMESRSIDVLVDDDGGAQLIAYSVFEQVISFCI